MSKNWKKLLFQYRNQLKYNIKIILWKINDLEYIKDIRKSKDLTIEIIHLPSTPRNLRSTASEFRYHSVLSDIYIASKLKQSGLCPKCLIREYY